MGLGGGVTAGREAERVNMLGDLLTHGLGASTPSDSFVSGLDGRDGQRAPGLCRDGVRGLSDVEAALFQLSLLHGCF